MHRALVVILILTTAILALGVGGFSQDVVDNLSEGRSLGVGIQIGFPWGGLISTRYWFDSSTAVEGIFFAWKERSDYTGVITGRVLYKISDRPTVDFYVVGGATLPFSSYGTQTAIFSAAGGIEFNLAFARNLALNVEFGGAMSSEGSFIMEIGSGIHFYF